MKRGFRNPKNYRAAVQGRQRKYGLYYMNEQERQDYRAKLREDYDAAFIIQVGNHVMAQTDLTRYNAVKPFISRISNRELPIAEVVSMLVTLVDRNVNYHTFGHITPAFGGTLTALALPNPIIRVVMTPTHTPSDEDDLHAFRCLFDAYVMEDDYGIVDPHYRQRTW